MLCRCPVSANTSSNEHDEEGFALACTPVDRLENVFRLLTPKVGADKERTAYIDGLSSCVYWPGLAMLAARVRLHTAHAK